MPSPKIYCILIKKIHSYKALFKYCLPETERVSSLTTALNYAQLFILPVRKQGEHGCSAFARKGGLYRIHRHSPETQYLFHFSELLSSTGPGFLSVSQKKDWGQFIPLVSIDDEC